MGSQGKQETGQRWEEMPEPGGQLDTQGEVEREGEKDVKWGKWCLDEDGTFCSSYKSETSQGLQSPVQSGIVTGLLPEGYT